MGDSCGQRSQRLEPFGLLKALLEFPGFGGVLLIIDHPFEVSGHVKDRKCVIVVVASPARVGALPANGLSAPQTCPDGTLDMGLLGPVDDLRVFLPDQVRPVNHLAGAVHPINPHPFINQEDGILDGVKADLQFGFRAFHRVEEHCILDGNPELVSDGPEQFALRLALTYMLRHL